MPKRVWKNGPLGGTPLEEVPLNALEADLEAALVQCAASPESLFSGSITRDANGAATSAAVIWPDGVTGVYSGTPSATFSGAVDAYTVTRTGTPTITYTQAAVTRSASGSVTNRPPITKT